MKYKRKGEKGARHILPHRGEGGGAPLYPIKPGRFSFLKTKCETIGGWARLRETAEKVPHKKVPQKYQVAIIKTIIRCAVVFPSGSVVNCVGVVEDGDRKGSHKRRGLAWTMTFGKFWGEAPVEKKAFRKGRGVGRAGSFS